MFLPQLPLASTFTFNNFKSIFSFQLSFNMSKFIEIHVLSSFSCSDCSTCKVLPANGPMAPFSQYDDCARMLLIFGDCITKV